MLACRDGQYDGTHQWKNVSTTVSVTASPPMWCWHSWQFCLGVFWEPLWQVWQRCGFSLYHAFLWRQIFIWEGEGMKSSYAPKLLYWDGVMYPSIHPSMSTYLKFCNGGSKQRYSSCPSPQHHFQFGLGNPETFPGQVRSVHWILGLAWCHLSVECAWKKFPGDPLTGYPNDLNHIFKAEQRYPAEETCPLVFPTLIFRSLPWYHDQGWGLEHNS